jgi:hypothetical protein
MLHFFSRSSTLRVQIGQAPLLQRLKPAATSREAARPDFDPSDFEEPTPTVPGSYWHDSAQATDDDTRSQG